MLELNEVITICLCIMCDGSCGIEENIRERSYEKLVEQGLIIVPDNEVV